MSPVSEHPTVISVEGAYGQIESQSPEDHDGNLEVLVSFESGERLWVPADQLILQEDGNFQLTRPLRELAIQHTRPTVAARPADFDQMLAEASVDATQKMPRQSADSNWVAAKPVADPVAELAAEPVPPVAEPMEPPAVQQLPPEDELEEPYFPAPAADLPETPAAGIDHVRVSQVVESYREDIGASLLREDVEIHRVPVNQYVDEAPPIRYEDDRIIIPVLEEVLHVEKRLLVKEEVVVTKHRTQAPVEQRELRQETHVVAEPVGGEPAASVPSTSNTDRYRQHFDAQRYPGARGYAYYEPAYRFGELLQSAPRYRGWDWDRLEPEARAIWERDNPGTWSIVQPAVRYAWSADGEPR